jgi:histidinol-phosphate aminotransferase
VPGRVAEEEGFFRRSVTGLLPYEPGKPVEEVQRELGLERVVKLASNEGPYGPFPRALEALERCAGELNRYPDGGVYRLRGALADRHGVGADEVAVGAGIDGVVDCLSQVTLEEGDAIVCGWPSFPMYVIDAVKMGAEPRRVPLRDDRYDLPALLEAVDERTKIVYVAHPNNPTGTTNTRAELDEYFERVPGHVLTVLDQAYLEYVLDPDYPDGIEEYFKAGCRVLVLRTFSKIYGLAGLRVGYGVGPGTLVAALGKVRRPFDVSSPAQDAALASLDHAGEVSRRALLNVEGRAELERILRRHGWAPAGPAVGNFLFVEVGDAQAVFDELLRLGVIVRPCAGFGAPGALRITVGTADEHAFLERALAQLRDRVPATR